MTLWSIFFCLGILCIQLHPALSLDHPVLHSHIPIRVFVVDVINPSEDFAVCLLCVCCVVCFCSVFVHVWIIGSFVLETIPHPSIVLWCIVRYLEGVQLHAVLIPKLWSYHFPLQWGLSPHFHPTCERRKGSSWCQDLPPQNQHHQTLPNFSINLLLQIISECNRSLFTLLINPPR